jgi:carboxymethylenebutenolidase
MIEHDVQITTQDGPMNTFITCPEEGGPFPIVLLLMDAMGKREELHDMARRLATAGYYVLLPQLYYRRVREFVPDGTDEGWEIMFEHMNSLSNSMIVNDCRSLLAHADQQASARPGPVGVVGYSMSGPFAFAAAAQIPDRIKAAASLFGIKLVTDTVDSPHLYTDGIAAELYFGFAEIDDYVPREMVDALESYLKTTDINYRFEIYPGTEHAFTFPLREGKYHKQSAERHWEKLLALFDRSL